MKITSLEEEKSQKQQIASELLKENESLRSELRILLEQVEGGNMEENIKRMNGEWEKRVSSMKDKYEKEIDRLREQVKNQLTEGLSNGELMNENRRLNDSLKQMKKEYEKLRTDQENSNRQSESQRKKLIEEYERKIKNMKETNER